MSKNNHFKRCGGGVEFALVTASGHRMKLSGPFLVHLQSFVGRGRGALFVSPPAAPLLKESETWDLTEGGGTEGGREDGVKDWGAGMCVFGLVSPWRLVHNGPVVALQISDTPQGQIHVVILINLNLVYDLCTFIFFLKEH